MSQYLPPRPLCVGSPRAPRVVPAIQGYRAGGKHGAEAWGRGDLWKAVSAESRGGGAKHH